MTRDLNLLPIEAVSPTEEATILALNNRHAEELSWLEAERLSFLLSQAFYARRIGSVEAFIMTFDQDADYDSPNFLWLKQRYPRFVYVDRIVIDPAARKHGYGRILYEAFLDKARADGHTLACCEINLDPPNPGSDAFHARMGFSVVGQATLADGKSVRYLTRSL